MPSLRQIETAAVLTEEVAQKFAPQAVRAAEATFSEGLNLVGIATEQRLAQTARGAADVTAKVLKSEIAPCWDKSIKLQALAERSTAKGDSWTQIYKEAFPPEESDSIYAIRNRVASGASEFFETRGSDGRVLTFSLFDRVGEIPINGQMSPVFFNSYNATRAGYRGMGLGSKHMGGALTQLFEHNPTAVVPFEIDHVGLKTLPVLQDVQAALKTGDYSRLGARNMSVELTQEEMRTNLERLQFYQRLGSRTGFPTRVANLDYRMPNLENLSAEPLPAHLLYFSERPLPQSSVGDVVRSIFTSDTGYGLEPTHPVIKPVLDSIGKTAIAANLH